MDKCVYKCVDKLEDNCVDNQNISLDKDLAWLKMWSEYLVQTPFNLRERNSEQIRDMLQALIEASLQGDSGLAISSSDVAQLGKFAVHASQAAQTVAPMVFDDEMLALYRYWSLEQRLATQVHRLTQMQLSAVDVTSYTNLLTDPHQQAAMKMVANHALNIITGGPGTGKTYTLARIIAVLNQAIPDIRIAMAAPTGKAAQRMQEALQASFQDPKLLESGLLSEELQQQSTQTLHRLLGLGHQQRPRYHAKQPLPYDVVVVDEASMLDLQLATLLFEAIPANCRLILLGDAKQLASVDVGAVLADLQQVPALKHNHVQLVTSRRFNAEAKIGQFAGFIQHLSDVKPSEDILAAFEQQVASAQTLQSIQLHDNMSDLVQLEYLNDSLLHEPTAYYLQLMQGYVPYVNALKQYREQAASIDLAKVIQAFDDYRILVAIRFGKFGLDQINRFAEDWLTTQLMVVPVAGWYLGRPVMMTYNDYQLGLSNGDIGICFRHRTQSDQFEVYFPSLDKWVAANRLPKNIQTAFALTIHKSQGSEFKHTAIVFDASAEKILSQELIYTAITRAKNVVSLLVDRAAFLQSLTQRTARKSGLVKKLIMISF